MYCFPCCLQRSRNRFRTSGVKLAAKAPGRGTANPFALAQQYSYGNPRQNGSTRISGRAKSSAVDLAAEDHCLLTPAPSCNTWNKTEIGTSRQVHVWRHPRRTSGPSTPENKPSVPMGLGLLHLRMPMHFAALQRGVIHPSRKTRTSKRGTVVPQMRCNN